MRTQNQKVINFHHSLGDIRIKPAIDVRAEIIKRLIQLALDSYLEVKYIDADVVHDDAKLRHGDHYQTPGYYLKLFRTRSDMTQQQLAEKLGVKQHHLSEMENNKRAVGKVLAKRIADILNFDYRKLL